MEVEGTATVVLKGDLDFESTEVVLEYLVPDLKTYNLVALDFEEVPFVDSSGIGLLLQMVQQLRETNTEIKIKNISNDVEDIFNLLQIPDILGEEVFVE